MKKLLLWALLVAALLGMTTGTAYASHTSALEIDVQRVNITKDGNALIRFRAKCTPTPGAHEYNLQSDIFLPDANGDPTDAYLDVSGVGPALCTGKWQRFVKVVPHQEGTPVLHKRNKVEVTVYYQLYPEGYDCDGRGCFDYEPGTHDETVRVH